MAIYAITFLAAMAVQLVVCLDVTRPSAETCSPSRSDEVRASFGRALGGMLLTFGAVMPIAMFAARPAAPAWALLIPLRLVVARFGHRP